MIQRIQTIYLALAAILLLVPVAFRMSLATLSIPNGEYHLTPVTVSLITKVSSQTVFGSYSIAIGFVLSLLLTVYAIFQFKDRKFQMRLVQMSMILQPIIGIMVLYYASKMAEFSDKASLAYQPTLAVLALTLVLYYLAYRGIRKDDALVRSADRLR
ncbi:MAG: hypothetical protein RL266_888 [Bacteroidota bacterium]|jgi:hypothetical protein